MPSLGAVRILLTLTERPIDRRTNADLPSIRPGAWATWAHGNAATHAQERTRPRPAPQRKNARAALTP